MIGRCASLKKGRFNCVVLCATVHSTPSPFSRVTSLPTPSADVLTCTKLVYEEDIGAQRWLFLPSFPEEKYVKMYVTSTKRVGAIPFSRGWVVHVPIIGEPIVDQDSTFICAGHLKHYSAAVSPKVSPKDSPHP